ncbi:carboxypeptidase-like regulatory domain-containing protein [Mucilaginibacter sp. HMF5004]|uniref:carboxypeptidase-like regulatory domain-containing protein n=1 Tax=Mucilaginibacter rivuli TaxID=2857527 RepID=UPI001C5F63A9|nr:carboxypeptidase-like regulatory domain-containing protein [Mucilaginibacter rivuli]MBW4890399.1 carboxypeptidase-like regulatory domain-containing protein [Mucilaginibacter rivuli]
MKVCLILLLWIIQISLALAQEKQFDGIVFDKETKERIAKVNILNLNSNANNYDNLKAEFKISAKTGDVLIFSKTGYINDTVKLGAETSIAVYMKRKSIQLKEVSINDNADPQKRYEAAKREYNKVYGTLANRDLLSIGNGGAGLSIDGLYNILSFRGRNAARLRETIERDYHENTIDARFNHQFVANITELKEPELSDFMLKYRPSYYAVTNYSDYEFIKYTRNSFVRYKRNPKAFALPPLVRQPE